MAISLLGLSSLLIGTAAVMLFVPGGPRAIGILAIAGVGAYAVAQLLRCRHPSPGLLPPVTADDGSRTGPRWCCHECGKVWPAAFEHESRPIQKYTGYDESKATAAARRAEALTRQQRGLAVRRSGLAGRSRATAPQVPAHVATHASADVVAIRRHRLAKERDDARRRRA